MDLYPIFRASNFMWVGMDAVLAYGGRGIATQGKYREVKLDKSQMAVDQW